MGWQDRKDKAWSDRWVQIDKLGEGGQGTVHLVVDKEKFAIDANRAHSIVKKLADLSPGDQTSFEDFRRLVAEAVDYYHPANRGALKLLHLPEGARDPDRDQIRIKDEIRAMAKVHHPNLLHILDHDPECTWFVSEFHPNGTLADLENREKFKGDFVSALCAFRALVDGVAALHEKNCVHRDVKPKNVFLGSRQQLILGDFGLVFFTDFARTRVSATLESVGTHHWMPFWAEAKRVEEVTPTFDVYSLGKLLWSMLTGRPQLSRESYDSPDNNVEELFPDAPYMHMANELFSRCVVAEEKDCLPDASALLQEIDAFRRIIRRSPKLLSEGKLRRCQACGEGEYKLEVDRDPAKGHNFGLGERGSLRVYACDYCGHIQLFSFPSQDSVPEAWREAEN